MTSFDFYINIEGINENLKSIFSTIIELIVIGVIALVTDIFNQGITFNNSFIRLHIN